jgi:hypothetical protein
MTGIFKNGNNGHGPTLEGKGSLTYFKGMVGMDTDTIMVRTRSSEKSGLPPHPPHLLHHLK